MTRSGRISAKPHDRTRLWHDADLQRSEQRRVPGQHPDFAVARWQNRFDGVSLHDLALARDDSESELGRQLVSHLCRFFPDLLRFFEHVLDRSLVIEGLLRNLVVFPFGDLFEPADGVRDLDVLAR